MGKIINIAMISGWHVHAKQYADEFAAFEDCKITAVYDEDPVRGKAWVEELNAAHGLSVRFYDNYDELLADDSIHGVAISSPTNKHHEVMMKAALANKHIFTEKILALTGDECRDIKAAVEKNNLKFTISFVHKCRPELLFLKDLADSGELGDITYARVHNSHNGSIAGWLPEHFYDKEACGGGAMIDLGAHSMYLLAWILGRPLNYLSSFTNVTGRPVEDNAVTVMEFEKGAIGVSETGFVSTAFPFIMEVSGTKGTALLNDANVTYFSEKTDGQWVTPEKLPARLPSPLRLWVDSIHSGVDSLFGLDEAILLTEMMEGAYKSHKEGKKIEG